MIVGPSKDRFLELFEKSGTDFDKFNALADPDEQLSLRTFRRRTAQWVHSLPTKEEDAEDSRPVAGGVVEAPDRLRKSLKGRRFVFTSAQNNTNLHEEFYENLLTFCRVRDAQLVVGKFRYNKSGFQNQSAAKDSELWFDPRLQPYFINESVEIEEARGDLVWCGELDILPTAANPLSGMDSYTHTASSIIPHAKVQLKSVPVLKGDPIKMLYTTGAITQRNYIQRKTGQKAEFHHVFGALYVEIDDDGDFFARQIIADSSGAFQDLTDVFEHGEHEPDRCVEAINWGDIHDVMVDPLVADNAWAWGESMLDTLMPNYQFIHDLTDFKARNHHNIKDPHFLAERYFTDSGNVKSDMEVSALVLENMERVWCKTIVVESNHDQAFRRWLREADIRNDPENAEYYHTANAKLYGEIAKGNPQFHVFEWAIRQFHPLERTQFLSEDDSFIICGKNGIECGMHGHRGPNGARGNANSLRTLGRKCNIGHTHSAQIIDGIYVAGISCVMDMGYNKGPSSWSQSHIVTYPNGKRTIITMKNGKWKA